MPKRKRTPEEKEQRKREALKAQYARYEALGFHFSEGSKLPYQFYRTGTQPFPERWTLLKQEKPEDGESLIETVNKNMANALQVLKPVTNTEEGAAIGSTPNNNTPLIFPPSDEHLKIQSGYYRVKLHKPFTWNNDQRKQLRTLGIGQHVLGEWNPRKKYYIHFYLDEAGTIQFAHEKYGKGTWWVTYPTETMKEIYAAQFDFYFSKGVTGSFTVSFPNALIGSKDEQEKKIRELSLENIENIVEAAYKRFEENGVPVYLKLDPATAQKRLNQALENPSEKKQAALIMQKLDKMKNQYAEKDCQRRSMCLQEKLFTVEENNPAAIQEEKLNRVFSDDGQQQQLMKHLEAISKEMDAGTPLTKEASHVLKTVLEKIEARQLENLPLKEALKQAATTLTIKLQTNVAYQEHIAPPTLSPEPPPL